MNDERVILGLLIMSGSLIDGALPLFDLFCIPIGGLIVITGLMEK